MSRRMKVILSVVAAVVLVAVGGAATVMAQDEPPPPPEGGPLAVVAEALGIPLEHLSDALRQAHRELVAEVFERVLAHLVEEGVVSDDEATAVREWWAQRPDPPDPEAAEAWLAQHPEISHPEALRRIMRAVSGLASPESIFRQPRLLGPLAERTAAILGIPVEDLISAFRRAFQQIEERERQRARLIKRLMGLSEAELDQALSRLVEEGRITEEQAERIGQQWVRLHALGEHARRLKRALCLGQEELEEVLAGLVREGVITQEQADRIAQQLAQVRQRLQGALPHPYRLKQHLPRLRQRLHQALLCPWLLPFGEEALSDMLGGAVERGRLTEDEAAQIRQWWQQRPEALDRLLGRGQSSDSPEE